MPSICIKAEYTSKITLRTVKFQCPLHLQLLLLRPIALPGVKWENQTASATSMVTDAIKDFPSELS